MKETYLGDGLYVSMQPYQGIRLRAPRLEGDHQVFLDAETLDAFLAWLVAVRQDALRRHVPHQHNPESNDSPGDSTPGT